MSKPIKVEVEDLGPHNGMGEPDPKGSYTAFRVIEQGDPSDVPQVMTFMCPNHQLPIGANAEKSETNYRLLRVGEQIMSGDQPLDGNCKNWGELSGWEVGMEYRPNVLKPVRRPLKAPEAQSDV